MFYPLFYAPHTPITAEQSPLVTSFINMLMIQCQMNTASPEGFESEVQGFIKWCTDNFLEVNASKTKEMTVDFNSS